MPALGDDGELFRRRKQLLCQLVDLGGGGLAAGEDAEVDHDLQAWTLLPREGEGDPRLEHHKGDLPPCALVNPRAAPSGSGESPPAGWRAPTRRPRRHPSTRSRSGPRAAGLPSSAG